MVSMQIVSNIELFVNWGAASALGVVLLVLTMAILWVASRFLQARADDRGRALMLGWFAQSRVRDPDHPRAAPVALRDRGHHHDPAGDPDPDRRCRCRFPTASTWSSRPQDWSTALVRALLRLVGMDAGHAHLVQGGLPDHAGGDADRRAGGLWTACLAACRFIRAAFVLLITPMMVPVVLVAIGAFYAYVKLQILYTMTGLVLAHTAAGAAAGGDRHRLGAEEL